ncbi:E3 ubiquitin-protein ligase PUB23-like isoform X2 [Benincasa hispida]|uniref:E3 ubiquitin-protein ligase PUB23-like isoform X2 n=1 Tax=Benincasa hispida TaxID=102211 RepID=UPI00190107C0|nr:E3 ubiquitin-protein ligase PUB23-like isoform X2 [Benincasa hispida]
MAEIEVPSDFLCPISLQIMRDPVTISTGITYDRESIEKWLSSCKNLSCPVTKQALGGIDLTPNHTLRRVIQGWCSLNNRHGVEQIPTPNSEDDRGDVVKLILKEAVKGPRSSRLECLKRLKDIVAESERNKIYFQNVESMECLASILKEDEDEAAIVEETIEIISNINSSTALLKHILTQNPRLIDTLISIITITKTSKSRAATIAFLSSLYTISDQTHKTFTKEIIFVQLTRALKDQIATKPTLKILLHLAPFGRNRIKAVKNGAVFHVVELLLHSSNGRECELAMAVLDRLCECAEGRAELLRHGGGMAVVGRKILRVSNLGNEKAVRIVYNVCKNNVGNLGVVEEMVEVGVVGKLCLMLQVGGNLKTKERIKEILHLLQCVFKGPIIQDQS